MGMPTDSTYGFIGQGVSTIGNMYSASILSNSQVNFLSGQKGAVDRQFDIDSERIGFEAGLRADQIRNNAEIEAMLADFRISDSKRREDLIRSRAKSALYAAGVQEKRLREQGRAVKGAQRAAVASSGLSSDSGTYEEAIGQTGDRVEEDAGILRYNTQLAIYGIDMEAAEVAIDRQGTELYKAGLGAMADIEAKLTLLAGDAERGALRNRADITKLNIDAQKFAVKQQRNVALISGLTELTGALDNAWKSLQQVPAQKKPEVRVPTYNPIKSNVRGGFSPGIMPVAY